MFLPRFVVFFFFFNWQKAILLMNFSQHKHYSPFFLPSVCLVHIKFTRRNAPYWYICWNIILQWNLGGGEVTFFLFAKWELDPIDFCGLCPVPSTERDNGEELTLKGAERSWFPWVSMWLKMFSKFKTRNHELAWAFNISAPASGPARTQRSAPVDANEDFHSKMEG